jgi:hypothetical protein
MAGSAPEAPNAIPKSARDIRNVGIRDHDTKGCRWIIFSFRFVIDPRDTNRLFWSIA